jgi:hypothetical protein
VAKCPFYQVHMHRLNTPDATYYPVAWCSHIHTPVSFLLATKAVGEDKHLNCGGDLEKCAISPALRPPGWVQPKL